MRKRLALFLALAMLFSVFAPITAFATTPESAVEDQQAAMNDQVDTNLQNFTEIMSDKAFQPNIKPIMTILSPILMLFSLALGLAAVMMFMLILFNTVMNVFVIALAKSVLVQYLSAAQQNKITGHKVVGDKTASQISLSQYVQEAAPELLVTIVLIGLVVTNQLLPVSIKLLGWSSSIIKGVTYIDLTPEKSSSTLDNKIDEFVRKSSEKQEAVDAEKYKTKTNGGRTTTAP